MIADNKYNNITWETTLNSLQYIMGNNKNTSKPKSLAKCVNKLSKTDHFIFFWDGAWDFKKKLSASWARLFFSCLVNVRKFL